MAKPNYNTRFDTTYILNSVKVEFNNNKQIYDKKLFELKDKTLQAIFPTLDVALETVDFQKESSLYVEGYYYNFLVLEEVYFSSVSNPIISPVIIDRNTIVKSQWWWTWKNDEWTPIGIPKFSKHI